MGLEKIGLEALFKDVNFQAGMRRYMFGLNKANLHTRRSATSITGLASVITVGLGGALTQLITRVIPGFVSGLGNIITSTARVAARTQELGIVLNLLGSRIGKTREELDDLVSSIVNAGVRTDSAQKLIAQFIRYNLDLSKALDLARTAQDAAVFSQQDSSDTLDYLLYGILTYNSRVLRTAGITITAEKAFKAFAAENGKVADQLSETDRKMAVLNAILREGALIAGSYEAAMQAPGKALRSVAREAWELRRVIGKPFLEAFAHVVSIIREMIKPLRAAVAEGGAFYKTLRQIGGLAAVVFGNIRESIQKLVDPIGYATRKLKELQEEGVAPLVAASIRGPQSILVNMNAFAERMIQMATDAFTWGVNIVTELASGMIIGASRAIAGAMNFITRLLTSWLAPGSAPKVAPKLPAWGAAAMTEYLKGFGDADFGILKSIQKPLQQALGLMADAGKLGKGALAPLYRSISEGLMKALGGGVIPDDLFAQIMAATGEFSEQIAELVRREFSLAAAMKVVTEATRRLNDAQLKENDAQADVIKKMKELNKLLVEGAPKDLIAKKREEFRIAKNNYQLSKDGRRQAERDVKAAEDKAKALKNQAKFQQELVAALLDLAEVQKRMIMAAAAGAGTEAGDEGMFPVLGPAGKIEEIFDKAFEDIKVNIRAKLAGIFGPIMLRWRNDVLPELMRLKDAFFTMVDTIKVYYGSKIKPILEMLKEAFIYAWEKILEFWETYGPDIEKAISDVWTTIKDNLKEIFPPGEKSPFEAISDWIKTFADSLDEKGPKIIKWIESFDTWLNDTFFPKLKIFKDWLNTNKDFIIAAIAGIVAAFIVPAAALSLLALFSAISITFGSASVLAGLLAFAAVLELLGEDPLKGESPVVWTDEAFMETKQDWDKKINALNITIINALTGVGPALQEVARQWGEDMASKIGEGIQARKEDMKAGILSAFSDIQAILDAAWNMGKSIVTNIVNGIAAVMFMITGMGYSIAGAIWGVLSGTNWFQLGKDMMYGLRDGMINTLGSLVWWAQHLATTVINAAKRILGIRSSSKVFAEIGENIMAGLAQGIARSIQLPELAMARSINRISAPSQSSIYNNISHRNEYNLTIASSAPTEPIVMDFEMMKGMAGVP